MAVICPSCGEREFGIEKLIPTKSFTRRLQKASYECNACGHKEVIG